jgi:hypothetical protein
MIKMSNYIYLFKATMECILAGSVCGVLFSLFSGQPLNIISATGPMLILESILKDLCEYKYQINYYIMHEIIKFLTIKSKNEVDFMEFRLWVGLWTSLFLLLIVMFNLSFLVKYITRFTEGYFLV